MRTSVNGKRSSFTASSRWLIALPAVFLAFFPNTAHADPAPGLTYELYDNWTDQGNAFNDAPPIPPTTPLVDSGIVAGINFDWGGGNILNSQLSEDVVIHFEGWLLPDTAQTYYVCAFSDDGFQLILDGETVINDWYDRGPSCGQTADIDFGDGQAKQLEAWYYENGGGAMTQLLYYTGQGWAVIPDAWYQFDDPTPSTTTTTTTTTTAPITAEQQRENERREEERRDYEKTSECEKVNHAFDSCPLWPGRTTTSTSTTEPATTTTSTTPPTTSTPEATSTSSPETTVPPTTSPETTVPETTTSLQIAQTTIPVPDTTLAPPPAPEPPVTPVAPSEPAPPAVAEATAILTDPAALEAATQEELEAIFSEIDPSTLTIDQGAALAAELNKAPKKAKKAFQESVNVFAGVFDSFKMADQEITVGDRRTLIAVANTLAATATVLARRRERI